MEEGRIVKITNCSVFKNTVPIDTTPINTVENIENSIKMFEQTIQQALEAASTKKHIKANKFRLPPDIRQLIKTKKSKREF